MADYRTNMRVSLYGDRTPTKPVTQPERQMDPVDAAHDAYRAAFAAHAENPTPGNLAKVDNARDKYNNENAKQRGGTDIMKD